MPRSRWSTVSALAHIALAAPAIAACGAPAKLTKQPPPQSAIDVERYREQVEAQVQPLLDAELVTGLVVGLYDGGKTETYGFGKGPGQGPPDGATLFELGPVTAVYTCLVFADAVQRREIELDAPLAELLPMGVTAPIRDKVAITLKQLALHSSGLPPLPPSIAARGDAPDPFAGYGENALYNDLIRTDLIATPGTQLGYSPYGIGLLGFTIGRKVGTGFPKLLDTRVLRPLEVKDTFTSVPAALAARRAEGSHDDLTRAAPWTYDALAGAGAVVSSARDQLRLIDAELDAASGGTGGFRAFLSFDPKTRRGVVVLASTATSVIDRLPDAMYKVLEGTPPTPVKLAGPAELAAFAGSYDLGGTPLQVVAEGKRLFLSGPGEPRHRLTPISDHEFWLEALQSIAVFEKDGDQVARVVFGIGERRVVAPRIAAK